MAIPNYLEKHFKEKAALKKQKEMMGDMDVIAQKIEDMENTPTRKKIDVNNLKARRKQQMESYI